MIDFSKLLTEEQKEESRRRREELDRRMKRTTIQGFVRGKPSALDVGIYDREDGKVLFGLLDESGELTHRSYYVDEWFNPIRAMGKFHDKANEFFYFDLGTTCAEIKVSGVELERAFRNLGMM